MCSCVEYLTFEHIWKAALSLSMTQTTPRVLLILQLTPKHFTSPPPFQISTTGVTDWSFELIPFQPNEDFNAWNVIVRHTNRISRRFFGTDKSDAKLLYWKQDVKITMYSWKTPKNIIFFCLSWLICKLQRPQVLIWRTVTHFTLHYCPVGLRIRQITQARPWMSHRATWLRFLWTMFIWGAVRKKIIPDTFSTKYC